MNCPLTWSERKTADLRKASPAETVLGEHGEVLRRALNALRDSEDSPEVRQAQRQLDRVLFSLPHVG
jgi:hypothetical protein